MAIHIQTGKKNLQTESKTANIQYMPFKIHADCEADIEEYFNRYIKSEDNEMLSTSFRGYPLNGKVINLPSNYVGLVLHESSRRTTEKEERKFFPICKFNNFTYWNWDKNPSKNDTIIQALDWIEIAEALHAPIEECQ